MSKARDIADLGSVTTRLDEVGNTDGALSNRNLLINSGFLVNQRGVTSTTGVAGGDKFLADRWRTYCNGSDWSASIQEVTLPDGTVANSLKTVATTSAASGFFHPYQKVEAYGKDYLQGKEVVLSAWVRTNVAGQFMRICDTVSCHLLGTQIPADGQWHKVSAVHTMPTSMNTGAPNFMQFQPLFNTVDLAVGDYCEFALPQMELGDTATPFEHRSYGDELARCQRYYEQIEYSAYSAVAMGHAYNTTSLHGPFYYNEKRAIPTIAVNNGVMCYNNATAQAPTVLGFGSPTKRSVNINPYNGMTFTANAASFIIAGASGFSVKLDAEL
jgi:hypothetical protein